MGLMMTVTIVCFTADVFPFLSRYVAYFMTAGTKPPMPHVGYCPHSAGSDYPYSKTMVAHTHTEGETRGGAPAPPPKKQEYVMHRTMNYVRKCRGCTDVGVMIAYCPLFP